MVEWILDGILDTLRLMPFLFVTYLALAFLEQCQSQRALVMVERAGRMGPVVGSLAGIIPQCGMSAVASNLYATGVISLGTLLAVYLSTSDEMLPILIAHGAEWSLIGQILSIKVLGALVVGVLLDRVLRRRAQQKIGGSHLGQCEQGCSCSYNGGIWQGAIVHNLHIAAIILVITLALNGVIAVIGQDRVTYFLASRPEMGLLCAAAVGLVPNCASSVLLTQLYLEGVLQFAPLMAGLFANAGAGLVVLFGLNRHIKENCLIVLLLYGIAVVLGALLWTLLA